MLPVTRRDGAEEDLPISEDDCLAVQHRARRRVLRCPLLDPRHLPWPSPIADRLGTLLARLAAGSPDERSYGLATPRNYRGAALATDRPVVPPRFEPGLSTTHGGVPTGRPDAYPDRTFTGKPSPVALGSRHVIEVPPFWQVPELMGTAAIEDGPGRRSTKHSGTLGSHIMSALRQAAILR
jgi:hypothetical protein